jgi:DNA-binding beta-propeller fold protein YncE
LAFFTALSDPEPLVIALATVAVGACLLMWLVHWYFSDLAFWVVLAVGATMSLAALLVEAFDRPPPSISTWRTEHAPVEVGVIPTGHRPRAIAADGRYVWLVGLETGTTRGILWRIDTKNLGLAAVEISSFKARNPYDIAVNDEAVWVADRDLLIKLSLNGDEVWRRDFGDGGENEVDVRFGKVWFKETDTGKIYVVDPVSGRQLRRPVQIGQEAVAIAVGLGSVWISSSDDHGKPVVVRLDPEGDVMGAISVLDDPQDLVAGRRHVYVAHSNDRMITRIEPDLGPHGKEVSGPRALKGVTPFGGIDAGGQTVWAALSGSNRVFAIAECTYRLIGRQRTGESPFDVAVLRGKAYIPNFHDGSVSVFRLKQPVCE